jgi:hypothetical protein
MIEFDKLFNQSLRFISENYTGSLEELNGFTTSEGKEDASKNHVKSRSSVYFS